MSYRNQIFTSSQALILTMTIFKTSWPSCHNSFCTSKVIKPPEKRIGRSLYQCKGGWEDGTNVLPILEIFTNEKANKVLIKNNLMQDRVENWGVGREYIRSQSQDNYTCWLFI